MGLLGLQKGWNPGGRDNARKGHIEQPANHNTQIKYKQTHSEKAIFYRTLKNNEALRK